MDRNARRRGKTLIAAALLAAALTVAGAMTATAADTDTDAEPTAACETHSFPIDGCTYSILSY